MLKRTIVALTLSLVACGGASASEVVIPSPEPAQADASADAQPAFDAVPSPSDAGIQPLDAKVSDASKEPSPEASDNDSGALPEAGIDASQPPPIPTNGVSFTRDTKQFMMVPWQGLSGASAATIEAWFMLRQPTDEGHIFWAHGFSCSYAGAPGYGAMQGHLNCMVRTNGGTAASQVFSQDRLTMGRWHHASLVLSAGLWTLYLDGRAQGTATADYGPNLPTQPSGLTLFGGTNRQANETIDGVIDEVLVSPVALRGGNFIPPAHEPTGGAPTLLLEEGMGSTVGNGAGTLSAGCSWTTVAR